MVHVSRATELPSRPLRPTSVISATVRGGTFDLVVSLSGAQERPFPFFVFDVLVPLPQCRSGYRIGRFVLVLLALMVGTWTRSRGMNRGERPKGRFVEGKMVREAGRLRQESAEARQMAKKKKKKKETKKEKKRKEKKERGFREIFRIGLDIDGSERSGPEVCTTAEQVSGIARAICGE